MRLSASDIRAPGRRITDEMKRLAAPVVLIGRLRAGVARRRRRRLRRDGHGGEERCRRAPSGLRLVRQPARLHEATCPAARWAVGVRRRGGREGLGGRGASPRRARPPERPASTTRRRTCRRRASTSPTWSSRTAPRCSSSGPTGFSPSTCAHGSRAWPAPCSCRKPGATSCSFTATGCSSSRTAACTRSTRRRRLAPFAPTPSRSSLIEVDVSDPGGDEDSAQPRTRRRLRQRPPRRDDSAGRDRLQHAAAAAVQGAGERRPRRRAPRARVSNRALVGTSADRQLAAFLQGQGPPRGDVVAPARSCSVATCGVPPCTPGSAC